MKGRSLKLMVFLASCFVASQTAFAAPAASNSFNGQSHKSSVSQLLDLNKATIAQLVKIKGLGKSKATAIIAYRSKVGKFRSLAELKEIKGIGTKLFAKIKPKFKI